ncbi:hypothetical protein PVK06_019428 [Gossypium arboreum]|uniref:Uncharacterized protein n=1 Tax=Gossypium arboreum TaxID=29729 RepID=A0ABR0PJN2_GOSAR|nr:hypothetical protein PVK06_019428 [Gossypium arboreum]
MKHLQLQHLLLFERNTRPLPDTPLVGGKTRNHPFFVTGQNTRPLHDTSLVDGTCTSVGRYSMLEILTREKHQLLVVGNPHLIGDVMKRTREGMIYSIKHPLARGHPILQILVGRIMSPMWIYPESPVLMVQKLHYFLNQCLFQLNLKTVKGVQKKKKKKIRNSQLTCLQPICIISIY